MTCCTTLIGDYWSGVRRKRYLGMQALVTAISATVFLALGGALGTAGWRAPFWLYLGEYAAWSEPERIVGNLHRAYAEIHGARPGAPIDVAAAFRDMVTYNGGRPLTCRA